MCSSISILGLFTLFSDCMFRSRLPLSDWEGTGSFLLAIVMTSVFVSQQLTWCLAPRVSMNVYGVNAHSCNPHPIFPSIRHVAHWGGLWGIEVCHLKLLSLPSSDTDIFFPLGTHLKGFRWGKPCSESDMLPRPGQSSQSPWRWLAQAWNSEEPVRAPPRQWDSCPVQ